MDPEKERNKHLDEALHWSRRYDTERVVKPEYESAARYLHNNVVLVPVDVAAWLLAHTNLAKLRMRARGADPSRDAVLLAMTLASHQYHQVRASGNGSRPAAEPELDPSSEWMSTGQAADVLGLSDRAVRAACQSGRLVAQQVAGRYRINRTAVDQYRNRQPK
jgi:excisionase family DNA binding protein